MGIGIIMGPKIFKWYWNYNGQRNYNAEGNYNVYGNYNYNEQKLFMRGIGIII